MLAKRFLQRAPAPSSLLGAALLAVAALALPVQAQAVLLVGNAEQTPVAGNLSSNEVEVLSGTEYSQEFTTGPGSDFLLETVRIFNTPYPIDIFRPPNYNVSVCPLNSSGDPDKSACTQLTPPGRLSVAGIDANGNPTPSEIEGLPIVGNRFEVPSGTTLTLSASTTYSLYVDIVDFILDGGGHFHTTTSDNEDAGVVGGWRLANEVERQTTAEFLQPGWVPQGKALRVRLFGTADADPLVSNAGQTEADGPAIVGSYSQEFTTGAATGGVLWSVETSANSTSSYAVSVCDLDSNGDPDTSSCEALTAPDNFVAGTNTFTALPTSRTGPSGVRLSAATTYSLHIVGTSGSGMLKVVTTGNEDTGGASGWSLANTYQVLSGGSWLDGSSFLPLRVKINGGTFMQTPAAGEPTVSGVTQVGHTLTISTSDITDANGLVGVSHNYQWVRVDGEIETDLAGATSRTYTLTAADAGKEVKARAIFNDNQGNREERTSEATATVAPTARACRTGNTWCGTLTAGSADTVVNNRSNALGYCSDVSLNGCNEDYGSLSDTDFTVGSTTYTIKSLRWGRPVPPGQRIESASLHLTLDKDLPSSELGNLTLVVDSHSFFLNDATRSNRGASLVNNYRWRPRPAALGDYVPGQRVTVDLLHSTGNNAPAFGNAMETRTVPENSAAGVNVGVPIPAATDTDMDPLTYRMSGADAASFEFDVTTRQISTRATGYDFEAKPSYTVTIHVADDRRGTDTVEVTINLVDLSEQAPPVPTGTSTYVSNLDTLDYEYGNTVAWPGIFGQVFQVAGGVGTGVYPLHSVSVDVGRMGAQFDITKTYVRVRTAVRVNNALRPGAFVANLENPTQVRNNVVNHFTAPPGVSLTAGFYFVTLGEGISDDAERFTVKLTDSDEDVGRPAWVIGNSLLSRMTPSQDWADEGQSLKMAVLGPSHPAGGAPIVSGSPVVGQRLTAVTDGIVDVDGLRNVNYSYQWIRVDGGNETDIEGQAASIYMLTPADEGNAIRVRVTFTDNLGNDEELVSPATGTVAASGTNIPPAFTATTQMLTFAENTAAGTAIGTALAAIDVDPGDTVTYAMEGPDASLFSFDSTTRQISTTTGVAYDFEPRAQYAVVVKARDDNGGEDTLVVGIDLSDVAEAPAPIATPTVERTPRSSTRLNVIWLEPVNTGPPITNYEVRYCEGSASDCGMDSDFTVYDAEGTETSVMVSGLQPGTLHQVQVRAINDEGRGIWSASDEASTFDAPEFRRDEWEIEVDEGADAGEVIYGEAAPAADSDSGATLTYSMEGLDVEFFDFDASSREILTKSGVNYDHEVRETYTVTIKADDLDGGTDTLLVPILVGNKGETPLAPHPPTVTTTSGATTSLDVSWTEPPMDMDNLGPPATDYDLRYCAGASAADCDADSEFTTFDFTGAGTSATITGLTDGTVYQVQVRASNDDFETGPWSESGIGKVGNNSPTFGAVTTLTFTLAENAAAGTDIGSAITAAMDSDSSNTLTYTLGGADASSFDLETTGTPVTSLQIKTKTGETYDFETKSSYTVAVQVDDGDSGMDAVLVTINLTNVNDRPTSDNASVTMDEDTVYVFRVEDFSFMDPDADDDALEQVHITVIESNGDLRVRNGGVTVGQRIDAQDLDDGDLTFIPTANESGSPYATFEFQVFDGTDDSATSYTMTINVVPVNDRPTSEDTEVVLDEDTTHMFQVGDFPFMDAEGGTLDTLLITTLPMNGTLRLGNQDLRANRPTDVDHLTNMRLAYIPEPNGHGSPYATFQFQVRDGSRFSARAYTMTLNVTPLDDPPGAPTVTPTPGSATSLDVSWTEPDNEMPTTDYDVQYCEGAASACTADADFMDAGFSGTGTSTMITGLTENTLYQVRVQSQSAGGGSGFSEYGEARTSIAPVFADDTLTITVDENVAGDVDVGDRIPAASDPGDTLTYSMDETPDAEFFNFIVEDRQVQTRMDVTYNFELRSTYTVTIRVVDSTMLADTLEVTIGLNNVSEPPGRPSQPEVLATLDATMSLDVTWTAPEDDPGLPILGYELRWCEGEVDECDEDVNFRVEDGLTVTVARATFTVMTEAAIYQVQVRAANADGNGEWSEHGAGRTNEPGNNLPVFTDTALTRSVAENSVAGVNVGAAIPEATDMEGDTLTYSMGGVDKEFFSFVAADRQIQTTTGVIYDHETRSSYTVTIRANDGRGGVTRVPVTISITNEIELPTAPGAPTVASTPASSARLDVSWDASADDADKPPITGYEVRWCAGTATDCVADGDFAGNLLSVTTTSASITGLPPGTLHQVQVRASNGDGRSDWSQSGEGRTISNNLPVFADTALTRSVAENSAAGVNVGAAIPEAMDADDATLSYRMTGADAEAFAFDAATRQISTTTGVSYDYETRSSYTVMILADDGRGGTTAVTVTISLTDVSEQPLIPVTLSLSRNEVSESGRAQTVVVTGRLGGAAETQDVTVRLEAGGGTAQPGDYTAPAVVLTLRPGETVAQVAFTVTPVDDDVVEADRTLVLTGTLSSSQSLMVEPSAGLTITITDDDERGVRVTPTALEVSEGDSATYEVVLRSEPTGPVTVTPTLADDDANVPSGAGVSPTSLTFTAANWSAEQTVTVTAADDTNVEQDATATVTHAVSGADYGANRVTAAAVTVTVPGFEEMAGGLVRLRVPPTGPVTVPDDTSQTGLGGLEVEIPMRLMGTVVSVQTVSVPSTPPPNYRPGDFLVDITLEVGAALQAGETATVCLPSATDGRRVYRYDDAAIPPEWVELPPPASGSPTGLACGVTDSFSIFALGPANNAPVFTEASPMRGVPEMSAPGVNVGMPVTATDADGDNLTYTLEGADATAFTIDSSSGQIQTTSGVDYDRATKSSYTVTVRVRDGRQGTASVEVIINLTAATTGEVAEAWLARFGRTAAGQMVESVGARLNAPTAQATQLNLGGSTVQAAALSGVFRALSGETAVDAKQTLANSSFVLPLAEGEGERWTAWGRGAYTDFEGKEGDVDLDGEVTTGTVGMDLSRGNWLTGVAVSHSEGDGDSRSENGTEGEMDISLSSVSPYAKADLEGGLSVWGMAGYGEGDLERKSDAAKTEVDLEMQMAAAGVEGPVGTVRGKASDFGLTLKADALAVRMEADGEAGLPEVKSDAQRLRVLLSGAGHHALESGGGMSPNLEAGLRWDEGDAETGLGIEIGAGMRFADSSGRLSADLKARGLVAHEESDYEEWGVSGLVALVPGRHGRGLSLQLESGYGQVASGTQELWSRRDLAGLAPEAPAVFDSRLGLEMGYGFNGLGGRGAWTPYLAYREGTATELRLGTRLDLGETMRLELSTLRGEDFQDAGLRLQGRW